MLLSQRGHNAAGSGLAKKPVRQLDFGTSGCCPNEELLLRRYSWEWEAKRGTSPFFLHPASLPLAPPTGRAQQEAAGKARRRYAESQPLHHRAVYIERVDLELRDSNLITGAGAFVSSSHHLCFGYMVQPQWNLKGSLRETSKYNPFIHWFTEHISLNTRHALGIGDRAMNTAVLAREELTPHACTHSTHMHVTYIHRYARPWYK